jgi:hypothetical protein
MAMTARTTTDDSPRPNWRQRRAANQQTSTALTVAQYGMHIAAAAGKTVENYVEMGSWLNDAKRNLPHGKYGELLENLRYSRGMASKLRKIDTAFGSNVSIWKHLPPGWTTLYQLALIPMARLEVLIEEGIVHAGIEHEQAVQLANDERPQRSRRAATAPTAAGNGAPAASHHVTFEYPDGRTASGEVTRSTVELRAPYYPQQNGHAPQADDHSDDAYELPDLIEGIFNDGGNGNLTLQRRIEMLADRNADPELRRDVIGTLEALDAKTTELLNLLRTVAGEVT